MTTDEPRNARGDTATESSLRLAMKHIDAIGAGDEHIAMMTLVRLQKYIDVVWQQVRDRMEGTGDE